MENNGGKRMEDWMEKNGGKIMKRREGKEFIISTD